ncbi:hypothetical protein RQP46_010832 [Phenoliferia psychrophenolica]
MPNRNLIGVALAALACLAASNPITAATIDQPSFFQRSGFTGGKRDRYIECSPDATGHIGVSLKKGGKAIGLIARDFASEGPVYTVTTSPNHSTPLLVTLPSTKFKHLSSVFNIATKIDEPDPAHPFLGAALIVDPLKKGSAGYAFLSGTVAADVPGKATLSTSKVPSLGESKIWKLDCTSHRFSIDWINNDGSHFPATFFFFPRKQVLTDDQDGLGFYGDRRVVEKANNVSLQDVNLKFIPSKPCPQTCT